MFSFAVTRSGSLSATPQATTVTGSGAAAGLYLFSNLLPGEYVVKVAASNFTSSGVLQSYVSSSGNSTTGDDNTPTIHNFARTGTATQSTPNAFNGVMTNPIDGNTDGRTWSHTDGSANPWWRVDFSTPGTINQIVIWNRTDCCPERLNNALVELLNASGTVVWSGNVAANAPTTSTFNVGGVYGSAVRVSLTGSVALSLAEVQVFGVIDDEDGVTLPAFTRSTTVNVPVVVSGAAASAKLNAFFDWNADGDFMDAGEALTERTVNNGSNTLPVPVPANAAGAVNLGARFRLSTAGGLTATGAANDGEIEDYLVQLSCPTITNPSTAAPLCQGATGSNLTVSANTNTANSIRFVRFTTDQMAGTSPTTTEAANIYAGTAVATVTPTGAASPYTATLTAATAGWSGLAPGTYYVYAILNPDLGASCRPVQESTAGAEFQLRARYRSGSTRPPIGQNPINGMHGVGTPRQQVCGVAPFA